MFKFPKLINKWLYNPYITPDECIGGECRSGLMRHEIDDWCKLIATLEGMPVRYNFNDRIYTAIPLSPEGASMIFNTALDDKDAQMFRLRRQLKAWEEDRTELLRDIREWETALFPDE